MQVGTDNLRRLQRARRVAADQMLDLVTTEPLPHAVRLLAAQFAELDVGLSLPAPFMIPLRLSMTQQPDGGEFSYKRGAELLKYCRDKLEAVEDQIKVLDQGVLKSWTPE